MSYSADRWSQVEDLFHRALERDAASRTAFLAAECGDDEELLADVASLLESHDEADDGLDRVSGAIQDTASRALTASSDQALGERVGRFRLVREIGRGGMGVVYLAERADGAFEQRVAIKVIQRLGGDGLGSDGLGGDGLGGDEVARRRFLDERQMLARLEHSAIARLLDGGEMEDGRPYLVMEYVEGLRIDHWCADRQLDVEARLRLFREVCSAVESAHRQDIVHRDLKPSNLLVTSDGRLKLLDFGIAKLLRTAESGRDPVTRAEQVTRTIQRALTPEYASPEQLTGGRITAATDVYALGLLLYRLLTGISPQEWPSETGEELEEVICRKPVETPSAAVRRLGASDSERAREITATRSTTTDGLARALSGGLDRIVLRAVHKDPEKRYASVAELDADIGRWLDGRRVRAGRSGVRRRLQVASVLALVLVGLGLWWLVGSGRTASRTEPAAASSAVDSSIRRTAVVLGFQNLSGDAEAAWLGNALSELLASELSAGEELRVVSGSDVARGLVESGQQAGEHLAPATVESLARTLDADVALYGSYLRLDAGTQAQLRVDCRIVEAGRDEAVQLSETGSEGEFLQLVERLGARLRESLGVGALSEIQQNELSASRPGNPQATRRYASGLDALHHFDVRRARDLLQEAVAADPSFAMAHAALADAWSELGYDGRARDASRRAFELASSLPRTDRLAVEGQYFESMKDWDAAIEVHRTRQTLFPDDPDPALDLAGVQILAGNTEEALQTLADLESRLPKLAGDPRIALVEAEAAGSISDFERQRDAARRAAAAGRERGASLLVARARLAEWWALRNLGDFESAGAAAREARRLFEAAGDRGGVARAINAEATLLADQGKTEEATKLDLEALEIFRQIEDRRRMSWSLNNLARGLRAQGDLAGARRMYEESLEISREIDDASGTARALAHLGRLLLESGEVDAGERLHEESLALRREIGEERGVAGAVLDLGVVQLARGQLEAATEKIQSSAHSFLELGDKQSAAHALDFLGDARMASGDLAAARSAYELSFALRQELGSAAAALSRLSLARLTLEEAQLGDSIEAVRVEAVATELEKLLSSGQLGASESEARSLLAEAQSLLD